MKRTAEDEFAPAKRARATDPHAPDPVHDSAWAPGLSTAFYGDFRASSSSNSGYNPYAPAYAGYAGGGLEGLGGGGGGAGAVVDAFANRGLSGNVGAGYAPGFSGFANGFGFGHNQHGLVVDTASTSTSASASASACTSREPSSASTSFTLLTPDARDAEGAAYGFPAQHKAAECGEHAAALGHDMRMEMGLSDTDAMMEDTEMDVTPAPTVAAPPPSPVRARAHTVPSNSNWPAHPHPLSNPSSQDHPLGHAYAHGRGYHAYSASMGGGGQHAHPDHGSAHPLSPTAAGFGFGYGFGSGYGHAQGHALKEPRPLQPKYPQRPAATPLQPRKF